MKRFCRSCIVAMVILLFLLGTGQGLAQEKKIVLRVAASLPPGHFLIKHGTKYWMESVTRATNGLVEFQHYPAEQLGKAKDLLALTLSGVTDIAYVVPSYHPEKMPFSAVAELPGIFPTSCVGTKAYWSLAKDGLLFQKEFAPNGVRLLFTLAIPPYQLWMRKNFETLKEVENSKIRTAGGAMDVTIRHLSMRDWSRGSLIFSGVNCCGAIWASRIARETAYSRLNLASISVRGRGWISRYLAFLLMETRTSWISSGFTFWSLTRCKAQSMAMWDPAQHG